jgi:hypothetical protein
MKVLSTNNNNDLYLNSSGNISVSDDLQAVIQACESAVKTQRGEAIFQVDFGIPNFSVIWNGNPNLIQAEAAIRATLLNVDNVLEISEFDIIVKDNIFSYNATIKTTFGEGTINGL